MGIKSEKDITPLIMWLLLFCGAIGLALLRIRGVTDAESGPAAFPNALFAGLYLLWVVVELRVSGLDANTEGKTTFDAMTCQVYGEFAKPRKRLFPAV